MAILDQSIYYFICIYVLLSCTEDLGAIHFLRIVVFLGIIKLFCRYPEIIIKKKHFHYILGLLLSLLIAVFSNDIQSDYYEGVKILWTAYLMPMLPMVLIILFIRKEEQIKKIIVCLMISFIITNIGGIWEFFHGVKRVDGLVGGGIMSLAGILILLVPILFILIVNQDFMPNNKALFIVAFFVAMPVVLFNATRIVWISLAIIFPILWYLMKISMRKIITYTIISFLAFISILNLFPYSQARFFSISDSTNQSNSERLLMWNSAWNMFADHPIVGVGVENYEKQYQNIYISSEAKERNQKHAHNNILHIAASAGIIGLTAYISMFGYFLYESFRNWWFEKRIGALMFFIATLGFCIHGLTDYNLGNIAALPKIYWIILSVYLTLDKIVIVRDRVKL